MTPQHHLPADIERTSIGIITAELAARELQIPEENAAVVKRVIHTTADLTTPKICTSPSARWRRAWPPCAAE